MTTSLSSTAPDLGVLDLPPAPPVLRASAPGRRRRGPAWALIVVGLLLTLSPVLGGLFAKVAAGQQMIDAFAPHITLSALDRYAADLATLRTGTAAVDAVYADQDVPAGKFPGLDAYRGNAAQVDARATDLLARIRAAEPDYRQVSDIGGFDRVPFLVVASGIALTYAGGVLLGGRRRSGGALLLAATASVVLIGYPFASQLPEGTRAGHRLQDALAPVMTTGTVQALQLDFVDLVTAVGELDTRFAGVPVPGQDRDQVAALVTAWPEISSDLATLVGTINDNLDNYQELDDLDGLTSSVGVPGLVVVGWTLVGAGALTAAAVLAASPVLTRRRKDAP